MEETCGNVITEMAASTGVYDNKTVKSNEIREGQKNHEQNGVDNKESETQEIILADLEPVQRVDKREGVEENQRAGDKGCIDVEVVIENTSLEPLPVESEKISLLSVYNYRQGDTVSVYLPGLPVVPEVSSNLTSNRSRGPQFKISLEHGPFTWNVYKYYSDFLSLRRVLAPLRLRITLGRIGRGRKRGYLPHLLTLTDVNPLQITRTQNQLPKVRKFLNAVLNDREFRSHRSTLKFLEISRLSFIEDLGSKRKEGVIQKRSGGHGRVTNCLGCTACCVCKCSVWRQRLLVLKDSYLAYIRSDRHTIAGVLLFDEGISVTTGPINTGILYGLQVKTKTRTLLMKCHSNKSMREWKENILSTMASTGRVWVTEKRFLSFAPPRPNTTVQWLVDGENYLSQVATAMLAAKEEIYITDWMISPQIYLKRSKDSMHNLNYRLDKIILRKAKEGVKIFIQLYKEVTVAIALGSDYAKEEFKHPNIVLFRHPEHIQTGVYLWAHHEKIVVIDQTLAFVGGIDLCFGRYDDHCHEVFDSGHTVTLQSGGNSTCQRWIGKDYYNPYIREIERHQEPYTDEIDRNEECRMPWHDIASCVYGAPARDLARHFIQRYNFTRHEQSLLDNFLLPRKHFDDADRDGSDFKYLAEVIGQRPCTNAEVQILRSVGQWSAGTHTEHSIMNAYLQMIQKAEHFIYIENQFFISSLKEVRNHIVDALRVRIGKAYRNKEMFRVIVVMPLLPSFGGDFTDSSGTVLKAVVHWNYKTISRGEDSLYSKLTQIDGIPPDQISNYVSVYGLRTHGEIDGRIASEIVYVHSKCMIVDDRYTIIGSANINDRSMLGDRDSEVAIYVEDRDMIEGVMNRQSYSVGKFAHSLRCQLFREHLGLLKEQRKTKNIREFDVRDPVCDLFYGNWSETAKKNMKIYEEVFGGKNIPTDTVRNYTQLKSFKENVGLIASDVTSAKDLLSEVQGVIVPMPLDFLSEEDLLPQFGTKEAFAPEIFT